MGVSNGYDIGVNGRDLILKTSGKIYVKVADKFYELDFRNEKQKTDTTESSEIVQSDVVLLDTLSKENYPGDNKIVINNDELYITKGGSYKKINTSTVSNQTGTVEVDNSSSDNLFVQISDGVWSLGETSSGSEIEFIDNLNVKWSDYWFFNSVRDYFFDDVYGEIQNEIEFWNNIFFNVVGDDPLQWKTKSKSEIEKTVLTNIYKNNKQLNITDFKNIYESFWYSEDSFNTVISNYNGPYAELSISTWSKTFSPKSEITIGGCIAIVTSVVGNSVIIKFKDSNITLNADSIQKNAGCLTIYKKNNSTFLDVLTGNLNIYDSLIQNENNIRVRIGDLSSLDGYNGLGAVFNGNVAIKNGPFILNSDGSGSIGTELSWDKDGKISGSLIDRIANVEKWIADYPQSD